MKFTNYIALFAGLLSAASATYELSAVDADGDLLDTTIEERAITCVKGVHVVALGGQGTTNGDMGYLAPLANSIVHSIPHSNLHQIGYKPGMLGPQAIPYAEPILRRHLKAYSKKCPHTKIVIASYSVGAAVTMNTLCGGATGGHPWPKPRPLIKRYHHNILANVVYGDLTFKAKRPYNAGTCKKHHGLVPRKRPGLCAPYGRSTKSYCDHGDVNCCSGHNPKVHFSYPGKYDKNALQFVMNRWHRHKRNH